MAKKDKIKDNFLYHVFLIVGVFLIARLIGSFLTSTRIWGLNHAGYIEGLFFLYILLLLIVYIVYQSGRKRARLFKLGPPRPIYFILFILISGGLFYFLSTSAHFLGDGYQLIARLANPDLIFKSESYGDMYLHRQAALLLGEGDRTDVYNSFKYLSILSGLIFCIAVVYYGRKLFKDTFKFYLFIALHFLGAMTLLFYGYVETYSLVTAFLYSFFLASAAAVKRNRKSVVPVIFYAVAFFLHKITIIFLPALLVYILILFGGKRIDRFYKNRFKIIYGLFILAPPVLYLIIHLTAPIGLRLDFLSPLGDRFTTDNYFLLSGKHILDYINLLLLIIPITIVAFTLRYLRRREMAGRKPPASDNDRNSLDFFFVTAMAAGLWVAFLLEPKLGMARDWDLFSTMLSGAFVYGIYLFINQFGEHKKFKPAGIMAVILSLSIAAPWVAVHKSTESLYVYSVQMMQLDPKHGRTGLQILIPLMKAQGANREVQRLRAFTDNFYPEMDMHRQGERLLINHDYVRAEMALKRTIAENPSFYRSYETLARVYIETGKWDLALENLLIADAMNPYNSDVSYYLSLVYEQKNEPARQLYYLKRSIRYDRNNPLPYMSLAEHYYSRSQTDSSHYYLNALPDSVDILPHQANCDLAELALKLGDTAKASFYIEKYYRSGEDSNLVKAYPILRNWLSLPPDTIQ